MKRLKTYVKYTDTKFLYRPNVKEVVCNLKFIIKIKNIPLYDIIKRDKIFLKYFNDNKCDIIVNDETDKEYALEFATAGFANACAEDEFCYSYGRKIAQTRAQQNAFIIARDFYNMCGYIINNYLSDIDKLTYNCQVSNERCRNHIKFLVEN